MDADAYIGRCRHRRLADGCSLCEDEAEAKIAPRRVVCAALQATDGTVLLGVRHYSPDMHMQIRARKDGEKFVHLSGDSQGFVDQFGAYMTRREAFAVAVAAGQIVNPSACEGGRLYSEGLY